MATADSMPMSGLMSIGEACRYVGKIHPNTIRKYANLGELPCYRIGTNGIRRFRREDLAELFGMFTEEKCSDMGTLAAYARVSSAGQSALKNNESSLTRQIEEIENYCLEQYGVKPELYSETASSLNFKRPKLTKLIRDILAGKYDGGILVASYKDRVFRLGFELLENNL